MKQLVRFCILLVFFAAASVAAQSADCLPLDFMEDTGIAFEDAMETDVSIATTIRSEIEYRGSVIYRNGKVDMVLFPGGYATIDGTAVTFHYYTQDYLGNNRAVINGSTGAIEQTTAYYTYGAVIVDLGNPHGGQPYKFGGKELITANGLNEYALANNSTILKKGSNLTIGTLFDYGIDTKYQIPFFLMNKNLSSL